jgi:hypothetical protein
MRAIPGILVVLGCSSVAGMTNSPMPWLHGFTASGISDVLAEGVGNRVQRYARCDDCIGTDGIEVTANVVPGRGDATILATFSQGLVVVDRDGRLVATGPGYDPSGSADELLAVATGDASIGTPVIAIAARRGGRRASEVWLELYRVGSNDKLQRLFAGIVEEHEDKFVRIGSVTVFAGGLIHRAPRSQAPDLWVFDPHAGRYLYRGTLGDEPSHGGSDDRVPAHDQNGVALQDHRPPRGAGAADVGP